MSAQFVIAVMSSLTTAAILYLTRMLYKARRTAVTLLQEHRFMLRSINLILVHLDIEQQAEQLRKR